MAPLSVGATRLLLICTFSSLLLNAVSSRVDSHSPLVGFPPLPALDAELLEVYDGDHFADLAFNRNDACFLPTVLVLYVASCKAKAQSLGMFDVQSMPPEAFLTYMSHDYEAWKQKAWFRFSPKQDIASPYDVTSCPTALFWEEGSGRETRPARWTEQNELSFKEWIATRLVRTVSLVNELDHDVEFLWTDDGQTTARVEAGSHIHINLPEPWKAAVIARRPHSTDSNIMHAWFVTRNGQQLKLTEPSNFAYSDWIEDTGREQRKLWKRARWFRNENKERHRLMLEQPPQLQSFTELGFTHLRTPPALHERLLALARNATAFEPQTKIRGSGHGTTFNEDEIDLDLLQLADDEAASMRMELLPHAEKWCGCNLQPMGGGFLRRYAAGSRIRMHLDTNTVGKTMIGSVLQIDQDLQGAPDWEFRVIGLDGEWHSFNNTPGDLIFFEASMVPHGRPKALQGKAFINAFFFYFAERQPSSAGTDRDEL